MSTCFPALRLAPTIRQTEREGLIDTVKFSQLRAITMLHNPYPGYGSVFESAGKEVELKWDFLGR